MPSPTQSSTPLARIQPVKQELPSLEQMRADLLSIEMDPKQQQMVRLLAGSQRTIVDHLRLMIGGQRMMAQSIQKYVDGKIAALAGEVNTALASLTDPQPEPEAATESTPENVATLAEAEIVAPVSPPAATPVPTPSPNAPQMTVTPVSRKRSAQQPAATKAGAK